MRAGRPSRVISSPAEMRAAARRGEWRGSTGGQCPTYQQANLVILPKEAAVEFAAFCTRNPKPCPLIEITPPGDPEPARAAPGADLRTDVPGYRVYRGGELIEQRGEIRDPVARRSRCLPVGLQPDLRARFDRRGSRRAKRGAHDYSRAGDHVPNRPASRGRYDLRYPSVNLLNRDALNWAWRIVHYSATRVGIASISERFASLNRSRS
jgi:hypothetical protein